MATALIACGDTAFVKAEFEDAHFSNLCERMTLHVTFVTQAHNSCQIMLIQCIIDRLEPAVFLLVSHGKR